MNMYINIAENCYTEIAIVNLLKNHHLGVAR